MSVVSIATLKSYFQTGDIPTQAQFEDLIDTLDNASNSTYKTYVALLTQTGTSAPVATVLENTLGGTIVWTYVVAGNYTGTLNGAFTVGKSTVMTTPANNYSAGTYIDNISHAIGINTVSIVTQRFDSVTGGAYTNGILLITAIEIRVYP